MHVLASQLANGRPHHPASWGVHTEGLHVRGEEACLGSFSNAFSSAFCQPGDEEIRTSIQGTSTVTGTLQVIASTQMDVDIQGTSTVTVQPDDIYYLSAVGRGVVEVTLQNELITELLGTSTGESTVSATLSADASLEASPIIGTSTVSGALAHLVSALGRALVSGYLDNGFPPLQSTVTGTSTVSGQLDAVGDFPYAPLNYPLGGRVWDVAELSAVILGVGVTNFDLIEIPLIPTVIEGTSTTTGTLSSDSAESVIIEGDSTVTGELFVGGGLAEMASTITGGSYVFLLGNLDFSFLDDPFHYYSYINVCVGFDHTDTNPNADSQAFTDGDIVRDFSRFLYQYINVGVGFDDTDDASTNSGFVSQSYPDGDIVEDFSRFMYQYLNVVDPEEDPFHRLTIGPAPRGHKDLTPTPRPPRRRNR